MLDLSIAEILVVGVIALLVVGPQDLPKAMRELLKVVRSIRNAGAEVRRQLDEITDESGIKDAQKDINYIIDQNGEFQEVYDISDFLDDDNPPKKQIEDNDSGRTDG